MRFVDFCDEHDIILVVLPPHSTHQLQSLDVGIFSPLSTVYSYEIDRLIQSSQCFSRITKRNFWSLFCTAWKTALSVQNIRSAFAATGIHSFASTKVLNQLKTKTPLPPSSKDEAKRPIPSSVRDIHRVTKALRSETADPTAGLDFMIQASQDLVIKLEIATHENKGLRTALVEKKKRQKKGKPTGLFIKDEPGHPIFFSLTKVASIRACQQEYKAQKKQEKLDKELEH
jgi:DDE superfamily endonuclease